MGWRRCGGGVAAAVLTLVAAAATAVAAYAVELTMVRPFGPDGLPDAVETLDVL